MDQREVFCYTNSSTSNKPYHTSRSYHNNFDAFCYRNVYTTCTGNTWTCCYNQAYKGYSKVAILKNFSYII